MDDFSSRFYESDISGDLSSESYEDDIDIESDKERLQAYNDALSSDGDSAEESVEPDFVDRNDDIESTAPSTGQFVDDKLTTDEHLSSRFYETCELDGVYIEEVQDDPFAAAEDFFGDLFQSDAEDDKAGGRIEWNDERSPERDATTKAVLNKSVPQQYTDRWYYTSDVPTRAVKKENQDLLNYYHKNVHIDEREFNEMAEKVDTFMQELLSTMRANRAATEPWLGDFLRVGSSSENLKTVKPDEFDVILPITIDEEAHHLRYEVVEWDQDKTVPVGFGRCIAVGDISKIPPNLRSCITSARGTNYISRTWFLQRWFYPLLLKSVKRISQNIPEKLKHILKSVDLKGDLGTAIPLNLTFRVKARSQQVSIDVVAALPITQNKQSKDHLVDTRFVVITKNFSCSRQYKEKYCLQEEQQSDERDLLWRVSYSFIERSYLDRMREILGPDSCHITCIRLLKTMLDHPFYDESVGKLLQESCYCSYVIKTVFFHLSTDKTIHWSYGHLADRIRDFLRFFNRALRKRHITHFFYEASHQDHLKKIFVLEKCFIIDYSRCSIKVNIMRRCDKVSRSK